MRDDTAFAGWSRERQQRIEGVLERTLPSETAVPARLAAAMRYATLGGGKRGLLADRRNRYRSLGKRNLRHLRVVSIDELWLHRERSPSR